MVVANSEPHGIMLHHFWDEHHPRGQGAINRDEFARMIDWIGRDKILPAQEWFDRAIKGALEADQLCLTFDDALRCQYDVAVPVLADYGLTAFWFVYSSVFEGGREPLEIFRYFRTVAFDGIEAFYSAFDSAVATSAFADRVAQSDRQIDYASHLKDFGHYSMADRRFRYLRDRVLGAADYNAVMWQMIRDSGWESKIPSEILWMNEADLQALDSAGHIIGLHSYSHPTRLADLPVENQRAEYGRNAEHLAACLGRKPVTMSHPCNSYGPDTLDLLRGMGIRLGFRSNQALLNAGQLEMPRQDHATVLAAMRAA
jgi:peptidoglycan/xylan/chitin deacetylase (PgdA/CDA1 family)